MSTINEKMTAIADAIRLQTYYEGKLTLNDMAAQIPEVAGRNYDIGHMNGYFQGKEEGETTGVEQGKKSAYDEFWDSYQEKGNRTNYEYAFGGQGWNDTTFKPKYLPIIPRFAGYMFRNCGATNVDLSNIVTINEDCAGYVAMCRGFTGLVAFGNFYCSHNNCQEVFYQCTNLVTVKNFTSQATTTYTHTFYNCTSLVNITFAGTIGNDLNISYSPLNKASIESIIECLSATATGKTLTLKKTAKEAAFTDEEWAALIADKSNWTISLV